MHFVSFPPAHRRYPSNTRSLVLSFFRLASKFTRFRHKGASLLARMPSLSPLCDLEHGRSSRQSSSLNRSIILSPSSCRVRLLSAHLPRYFPCASQRRATRAFRFFSWATSSPRLPLTLEELLSLLSLPPFSSLLPSVRNSNSFQGNVYPRRKMRLKCIGACFPRRARAISTRILWVYHMTASYLGIHAYRCKDFRKTRNLSLHSPS